MKKLLLLLLLSIGFVGQSYAVEKTVNISDPIEINWRAEKAFKNSDYKKAFKENLLIFSEDEENMEAQLNLAMLFSKGWGIPKSYKTALQFYNSILDADYGSDDLSIRGMALTSSIHLIFQMYDEGILSEEEVAVMMKDHIEMAMALSLYDETPDWLSAGIEELWVEYELWKWEYK